jgi:ParB-like chromosome segregation protein Spo0J
MKKYELHELAQLFPPMDADDKAKLTESIKKNGLIEPIVLLDGKILDGASRYSVCQEEGIEGRVVAFEALTPIIRKSGPLEYVMARNLDRRHLNATQKATIAVDALPFFEAEAKERQSAGGGRVAPSGANSNGDEMNQDPGTNAADEPQAPPRGKKAAKAAKGKASAKAAKVTGASARSVERAKALKKKDPKKFAAAKAGKISLTKAERDQKKVDAAKAELADALKKISNVAGKDTAAVMEKRKRAEILELAGMSDADIIKVRGLIGSGWALAKAKKYKMTALGRTHSIGDLCTRALAQGVAKAGNYSLTIKHEGVDLEIVVKKAKE